MSVGITPVYTVPTVWDHLPNRIFRTAIEITGTLLTGNLIHRDGVAKLNFAQFWATNRISHSFYFSTKEDLVQIWDRIREFEQLTDIVLTLTTDIAFYLGEETWATVINNVIAATTILKSEKKGKVEISDTDYRGMLVDAPTMRDFIEADPWIVTVILLRYIDREYLRRSGIDISLTNPNDAKLLDEDES